MYPLKQSSAITLLVFAFDSSGDPVTGIADGSWTKRISKGSGSFASLTGVTITELENGFYSVPISSGNTDTLGILTIHLRASGVKQVNVQFRIDSRVPDDLTYPTVTGRSLDVSTAGNAGIDWANIDAPTSSQNLSGTTVGTLTTVSDKTGYSLSAGGVQAIWDAATSALTTVGSLGKLLVDNVNATISSRLASAAITLVGGAVTVGTNNDKTGYALSGAGVQAIWDALTAALTTVGSIGKRLADNIDAAISSRLATGGYTTPPTVGAIADQVWDEQISGHLSAGSTGLALSSAGAAGDPLSSTVPGSYAVGTAGYIIGTNLDAKVSSVSGGGGGGSGANAVTLTVQTTGAVPIANLGVTVKNTAQTAVQAFGITDSNGQVVFNLDNGSYKVLVESTPAYSNLAAQTLVVSGTTTATYSLTALSISPAAAASLCRIYATLRKLDGSVAALETVVFKLYTVGSWQATGNVIVVQEITVKTDAIGFFFADLTRTSAIVGIDDTSTAVYKVTATGANLAHTFSVPDAGSADLLTLTLTAV